VHSSQHVTAVAGRALFAGAGHVICTNWPSKRLTIVLVLRNLAVLMAHSVPPLGSESCALLTVRALQRKQRV